MPRTEPPTSETTQPFWDATRDQQLVVQWCCECDRPIAYPREVCPFCAATVLEWRPSEGRGKLYSFTVEHKTPSPVAGAEGPYAIGLVDLDEGVRLMSNIVNCPVSELAVGMAVRITWELLSDGRHLPLFEPA
jgi:uncharacterized OB-fold protein